MKNVKWLCGLLILVLLFAGCQAPVIPDADDGEALSDDTSGTNEASETTTPYVKRYAYPENIDYTTFVTDAAFDDGGFSLDKSEAVYALPWTNAKAEIQRTVGSTLSVTLGDRVLTGKYEESSLLMYDNAYQHEYSTGSVNFAVHAVTGKLVFYGVSSVGERGEKADQEVVVAHAKDFVKDLIDMDQYELRYEWNEMTKVHYVRFVKTLGEFDTGEEIRLTYREDGKFIIYRARMLDTFSDDMTWHMSKQNTDAVALAKAEDLALPTLTDARYGKVELSIRDCRLILTEDGRLAALYGIEVMTTEQAELSGYMMEVIVFDTADVKVPTAA